MQSILANQNGVEVQDDVSMHIEVKKVTDNIVICNLVAGGFTSEILLKRGDYDMLVEKGFFHLNSLNKQLSKGTVATSEVYAQINPHLVG